MIKLYMSIPGAGMLLAVAIASSPASAYSCGGDGVSKKEKCACIEKVRDDIRSQQRQKSTQQLRDDYNFWTKAHDSECRS